MSHIGIETVIGLGKVVRFHACGAPGSQTVADHSAKVALYAQILARHMGLELSDRDRADCYELALLHDAHETVFGDTPYPAKQMMQQAGIDMDALAMAAFWNTKGLPDAGMSQRAVDLVNLADHLEAALHAREYYPVKAFDTRVQVLALAAKLGPLYVGAIRAALWRPEPDEEASA